MVMLHGRWGGSFLNYSAKLPLASRWPRMSGRCVLLASVPVAFISLAAVPVPAMLTANVLMPDVLMPAALMSAALVAIRNEKRDPKAGFGYFSGERGRVRSSIGGERRWRHGRFIGRCLRPVRLRGRRQGNGW